MNTIPHNAVEKQCNACKKFFPASPPYFNTDTSKRDGVSTRCRTCVNAAQRARRIPKRPIDTRVIPEGHKRCSKCWEFFPATKEHFYGSKREKDGLFGQCKKCSDTRNVVHVPLTEDKQCTLCKQFFPPTTEYFNARKKVKSGLQAWCRKCCIQYKKDRIEHVVAYNTHYRRTHKEDMHQYYLSRKDDFRVYKRLRARLPESKASRRRYYIENREAILEEKRLYHQANREHRKQYSRMYRKTHIEEMKTISNRKRARKRNAHGNHTRHDVTLQYQRQRGRCYYCREKVGKVYHVDHLVPLAKGGSNGPENLVIACPACNMSKSDRLLHEWPHGGRLL